ncbi:MAG: glycosyltransferase, partial [Roseovarius sp.]|nr:glycosyltransferase [Roseovarius sp.]
MTDPTVLTVILNFRTPELTLKALDAAVREMAGIGGGIVVVDNGSGDDSCAVLSAAIERNGWGANGRVRLFQSARNGGFGAGNNFAIRAGLSDGSRPDYVYLLNSDAFPQPGAIRSLLSFMRRNPGAGIAGSAIRGIDGAPHQTAFRFPTIAGEMEGAARTGLVTRALKNAVIPLPLPRENRAVDWVAG